MGMKKAQDLGQSQGFKFETKGQTLKGYYLKTTDEVINGSPCKKHYFQTAEGLVTVLGQANMYKQLTDNNCQNLAVEITFTGQALKLKGGKTMKVYEVSYDEEDVWDGAGTVAAETVGDDIDDGDDTDLDDDPAPLDETPPARAAAPKQRAVAPAADRQARVQKLLGSRPAR